MVKKYTKLEIELYEKLTEIHLIQNKMSKIFSNNVINYANQNKKELDLWVRKIVYNLVGLDKVLEEAKIPKKFLILDKLSEDKKNG